MSEDSKESGQEEVDLGQLFKLIGNMFDRLFRFIGAISHKLFLSFVWLVFFIKSHIIKIMIAGVVGFTYGFFKQNKGKPIYKSTTVIKQNYDTGENIYRAIDYYNELIAENDSITLGNVLNIDSNKAGSIINLEVESVITENEKLIEFDLYTKGLDSIIALTVTFDDYVKNSKEFDYPQQRLIIKAREKAIFGSVVYQIIDKIVSTSYFITEQKKDLDELNRLENSILASLESSKELQQVYKNVLEKPLDNKTGSQTSIRIDNTEDKSITKEFELYLNDVNLRRELVEIQRDREDKLNIIEIISSQENQGTIDNTRELLGNILNVKIYYSIILMGLVSIILLTLHFIKFLEKYKNEI